MEKADNTIPSREELAVYMEESIVSVTSAYEQSPVVLMVDDAVIGTLGNFSASIGKAKSKKTFNVSAIVASALRGSTILHYRSTFPKDKRKVLYVDTEQGRYHCQNVLKRILRLADLPENKELDNLAMLALRKYSPDMRLAIVEQAIGTIPNLGLVVIDGIRDFLYDINSPSESTDIISKFMQWTDDRQIHIHTVLHQNKNDEHARGHIGTELNNKAETIMQVEVDKEDKTISVVEAMHIRDREFEPFAFRINEEGLPELVEPYLPREKRIGRPTKEPFDPYKEIPESVHRAALDAAFANGTIYHYRTIYMKENTENSLGSSNETRCVFIGAKVTPCTKEHIKSLAVQCGMTVSDYILSCAYNFKPKARLTKEEAALLQNLDNCRSDLVKYTSALHGMSTK